MVERVFAGCLVAGIGLGAVGFLLLTHLGHAHQHLAHLHRLCHLRLPVHVRWPFHLHHGAAHALLGAVPDALPLAAAVSAPLQKIDRIMLVNTGNGDGTGIERITKGIVDVIAQVPGVAEALVGIDLKEVLQRVPGLSALQSGGNGQRRPEPVADGDAGG